MHKMEKNFLINRRGPFGTRTQPDVDDYVHYIGLQKTPLTQLPDDPLRWYHSPYLWEMQEMRAQQHQVANMQVDEQNLDQLIRQTAQHHNIQAELLRQMVNQQRILAQRLILGSGNTPGPGGDNAPGPAGGGQTITNITAAVDPTGIANALLPLFQQHGAAIISAIRDGRQEGPEVFSMDIGDDPDDDPPRRKKGVRKQNRKLRFSRTYVTNVTNVSQPGPNTGGQMDLDTAAYAGGGSGPPPPPPPSAAAIAEATGLQLKPFMSQMLAHSQRLAEQQMRMANQLREQAIGDQVAQANEFRDTREALRVLGESVSASVTRSFDTSLKSLVAAVTAHQTAPDPQVAGLQRDFAAANARVGELERQLAGALAHVKKGSEEHQREAVRLREALEHAEQQQAAMASDLMAKVREYEQQGISLMQRLLEQQSINEENARLIAALKLQGPGGPPSVDEIEQAQASGSDRPSPPPMAPPIKRAPPATPVKPAAGPEPTGFAEQPEVLHSTDGPDPITEFVNSFPLAMKTRLNEIMAAGDREELVRLLDKALKDGAISRMASRQMTHQATVSHQLTRQRMLQLRERLKNLAGEYATVAEKKDVYDLMAIYLKAYEVDRRIRQREGEAPSYTHRTTGPRPKSVPLKPEPEPTEPTAPTAPTMPTNRSGRARSTPPAQVIGRASGRAGAQRSRAVSRRGGSSGGVSNQPPPAEVKV